MPMLVIHDRSCADEAVFVDWEHISESTYNFGSHISSCREKWSEHVHMNATHFRSVPTRTLLRMYLERRYTSFHSIDVFSFDFGNAQQW